MDCECKGNFAGALQSGQHRLDQRQIPLADPVSAIASRSAATSQRHMTNANYRNDRECKPSSAISSSTPRAQRLTGTAYNSCDGKLKYAEPIGSASSSSATSVNLIRSTAPIFTACVRHLAPRTITTECFPTLAYMYQLAQDPRTSFVAEFEVHAVAVLPSIPRPL